MLKSWNENVYFNVKQLICRYKKTNIILIHLLYKNFIIWDLFLPNSPFCIASVKKRMPTYDIDWLIIMYMNKNIHSWNV